MRLVAAACVLLLGTGAARAQELTHHGWRGAADYENGRFVGCHLDSLPAAQKDLEAWNHGDPIRIVTDPRNYIVIQFMVHFGEAKSPLPAVGTTSSVHLATLDRQNMLENSYS